MPTIHRSEMLEESRQITETIQTLQQRVLALGDQRRTLWSDLSADGVPQPEIARTCGVALHTVYMQLRRARGDEQPEPTLQANSD